MKVLITGGAGFIGSHVVEDFLRNTDWELILFDKLAYAANGMTRLRDIKAFGEQSNRVQMFPIDISHPISSGVEKEVGPIDYIVHMAAETHVDRSITDPRPFVQANVFGTFEMLEFARRLDSRLKMFIQFGTDEEFGPCFDGAPAFKEWSRFNPTNPYSATKAAAGCLALAWANTYSVPLVITYCMNAFGERQHPEKFIPSTVRKILRNETVTIHADATRTKAGSRFYIHARNIAAAVRFIIGNVQAGAGQKLREKFNIVGEREVDNLTLVQLIHRFMQEKLKSNLTLKTELVDFHSSRPGHDLRYALDGRLLREAGWEPPKTFEDSLRKTVEWMVAPENLHWLLLD